MGSFSADLVAHVASSPLAQLLGVSIVLLILALVVVSRLSGSRRRLRSRL